MRHGRVLIVVIGRSWFVNVRFRALSGLKSDIAPRPSCANLRLMHCNKCRQVPLPPTREDDVAILPKLPTGRAEVPFFVAAAPMPSASAHSLGALRLLEACTAVSYCSQVAASWPALARKRRSWELTITVRDSAQCCRMCNGPFQRSAYATDQTQGNQTGPRLYVNA